jgi:hypothetical protein
MPLRAGRRHRFHDRQLMLPGLPRGFFFFVLFALKSQQKIIDLRLLGAAGPRDPTGDLRGAPIGPAIELAARTD